MTMYRATVNCQPSFCGGDLQRGNKTKDITTTKTCETLLKCVFSWNADSHKPAKKQKAFKKQWNSNHFIKNLANTFRKTSRWDPSQNQTQHTQKKTSKAWTSHLIQIVSLAHNLTHHHCLQWHNTTSATGPQKSHTLLEKAALLFGKKLKKAQWVKLVRASGGQLPPRSAAWS